VHLMFTTWTGLPRLVRAWIDHLVAHFGGAGVFLSSSCWVEKGRPASGGLRLLGCVLN